MKVQIFGNLPINIEIDETGEIMSVVSGEHFLDFDDKQRDKWEYEFKDEIAEELAVMGVHKDNWDYNWHSDPDEDTKKLLRDIASGKYPIDRVVQIVRYELTRMGDREYIREQMGLVK